MTPNRATGQTPFSLVYGAEAGIPMELIYESLRVLAYDEVVQDQHRRDDAVLVEENRLGCYACGTLSASPALLSQSQGSCSVF